MSTVTYLHANSTTTGNGSVLDIYGSYVENIPPVLIITLTGSGSYEIEGSHDLQNWASYFTGSASDSRDLIVGIRYWRVKINSLSGSLTAGVGPVPNGEGDVVLPPLVGTSSSPNS